LHARAATVFSEYVRAAGFFFVVAAGLASIACAGTPTPLAPGVRGSVGVPHRGVITHAARLGDRGDGWKRLRDDGARWGHPRLVAAIEHAAREVARARPGGAPVVVGDLGNRWGGEASGHRSHRTGRDADILLYSMTTSGQSVRTPGFVRFGPDGLAQTRGNDTPRFVRIDLDRQWLFVRALVTAPEANIQWIFVARWLEALIVEHAFARGEDPELVWQAETVLHQPKDALPHDDHFHIRIACTPEESVAGCQGGGPQWPWLPALPVLAAVSDPELVEAIAADLVSAGDAAAAAGAAP
jgi:penicillin-insensitive murein endopeptidase